MTEQVAKIIPFGHLFWLLTRHGICTNVVRHAFRTETANDQLRKMKEEINVACCFCGQSLPFDERIEITIKIEQGPDEVQTVYGHNKCLDRVLHQSVPRGFDLEQKRTTHNTSYKSLPGLG